MNFVRYLHNNIIIIIIIIPIPIPRTHLHTNSTPTVNKTNIFKMKHSKNTIAQNIKEKWEVKGRMEDSHVVQTKH
jgi:hypothetical protein